MISRYSKPKAKWNRKPYGSIKEVLDDMDGANWVITQEQVKTIRDLMETNKADYRNKMIKVVHLAYEAGRKHDTMERQALVDEIVSGGFDV